MAPSITLQLVLVSTHLRRPQIPTYDQTFGEYVKLKVEIRFFSSNLWTTHRAHSHTDETKIKTAERVESGRLELIMWED